jgi:hypothetical protein
MNTKLKKLISEAGKPFYSRGEWHDSNMSGGTPIQVTKWDKLVDEYNGKRGYSTSTKSNTRIYQAEIENLAVGMTWRVSFVNGGWNYRVYKRGQLVELQRNLDELIAHFKDNNNANEIKTENTMKLKSLLQESMQRFGTKNIAEQEDARVPKTNQIQPGSTAEKVLDAVYEIVSDLCDHYGLSADDIEKILEGNSEARGYEQKVQFVDKIREMAEIVDNMVELVNQDEY